MTPDELRDKLDGIRADIEGRWRSDESFGIGTDPCDGCGHCDCQLRHLQDRAVISHLTARVNQLQMTRGLFDQWWEYRKRALDEPSVDIVCADCHALVARVPNGASWECPPHTWCPNCRNLSRRGTPRHTGPDLAAKIARFNGGRE
jgi:hypothetical protein